MSFLPTTCPPSSSCKKALPAPLAANGPAVATDLSDLFTNTPDYTPYNALPVDKRIFDPQKALTPFDEKFDWKAFSESEELDRTETMQERRDEEDKRLRKKKTGKKKKP